MLQLDHLVVVAETIESGVEYVEAALGVPTEQGGRHSFMGTHNHLLSLGETAYLEVIAIDPSAPAPSRPRWFNLDAFTGPPRLSNWICRSDNLAGDLKRAPAGLGPTEFASRGDLSWRITVPEDGCLPFDGLFPGFIYWDGDAHPAQTLPDRGLRLERLDLYHSQAGQLARALGGMLDLDMPLVHLTSTSRMAARFTSPGGTVTL